MSLNNLLFIRTYKNVGHGGPVPPVELLSIASQAGHNFQITIKDMGLKEHAYEQIIAQVKETPPDVVCMYSLVWEADLVHQLSGEIKKHTPNCTIIIYGPLASLVGKNMLIDSNIDCVILGDGEDIFPQILQDLKNETEIMPVPGIAIRKGTEIMATAPESRPDSLDRFSIRPEIWNLIPLNAYAQDTSWNGINREPFYLPITSSRGCPFNCTFCTYRNFYGQTFRKRSPQNVVDEIRQLNTQLGCREFHFFDAVFNFDKERAKEICRLIIQSDLKIHLAFPHGLRADCMDEELITLLKKAGTYRLVYGIESGSPKVQKQINKNLNLESLKKTIENTSQAGILVGGYFIFGSPHETEEDMRKTIQFAAQSQLDLAFFFKATDYHKIFQIYQSAPNAAELIKRINQTAMSFSYFSETKDENDYSDKLVNRMLLEAQQAFYGNHKRILQIFRKTKNKRKFLKSLLKLMVLMIQSSLLLKLLYPCEKTDKQHNHLQEKNDC